MGFAEIFLIAVGLAMDAFAVAMVLAMSMRSLRFPQVLIPGAYFGFFQALMPLLGYFIGSYFADKIDFLDHWITFFLLAGIGAKMIKDSFSKDTEKRSSAPNFGFVKMTLLALGTSIDALAVGVTFAFFKVNIWTAILITGSVTFVLSVLAVFVGGIFGAKFKSKAEFLGGCALIIIGLKILLQHLFS